jgi:hypothetical protein
MDAILVQPKLITHNTFNIEEVPVKPTPGGGKIKSKRIKKQKNKKTQKQRKINKKYFIII